MRGGSAGQRLGNWKDLEVEQLRDSCVVWMDYDDATLTKNHDTGLGVEKKIMRDWNRH